MQPLAFSDIARLLNRSPVTRIKDQPSNEEPGRWSLYEAENIAPGFRYPFYLLYLFADATKESVTAAGRAVMDPGKTQVVYPASLVQKLGLRDHDRMRDFRDLLGQPKQVFTIRDYLQQFIAEQARTYSERLAALAPADFVDPRIEVPAGVIRRHPNPLIGLLDSDVMDRAAVGVLLAEPGQGKTYMTRYVAAKLRNTIPIYVHSQQWLRMHTDDAASLAKTIAHSFDYYEAPIGWINGAEDSFVDVTMRAGLFSVLFDGFDEYVLWNRGRVDAREAFLNLYQLAERSGAPILITARTSFWASELEPTNGTSILPQHFVYRLLPFDKNHARNYFTVRFKSKESLVARSLAIYDALVGASDDSHFAGRGFVLHLIADLVSRTDINPGIVRGRSVIDWIMRALCEREHTRQRLPINAEQQLQALRLFAEQTAAGETSNTDLLRFTVTCVANLDNELLQDLVGSDSVNKKGKLSDHPLIRRSGALWEFTQEQVRYALLAEQFLEIVERPEAQLTFFVQRILPDSSLRAEIASVILDQLLASKTIDEAKTLIRALAQRLIEQGGSDTPAERTMPEREFGVSLALLVVNRSVSQGRPRDERTTELLSLLSGGQRQIANQQFAGTVASFDFRKVCFRNCRFDQVIWLNCAFDESSIFDACHFIGGRVQRCDGFGEAEFRSGWFDEDASALVASAKIAAGKKRYTKEDLRSDIAQVLRKFVPKEGFGPKTLEERNLRRGPIGVSPHREKILTSLMRHILEAHHISGVPEGGLNVRDEARRDVLHFASNGVFTGALARVYDELCEELRL